MSGGIKIAWYITTVITLEGLQANPALGDLEMSEPARKLANSAILQYTASMVRRVDFKEPMLKQRT